MKQLSAVIGLLVFGFAAGTTHAAATPEQQCQAERAKAAGAYVLCQQKTQAKLQTTGDFAKFQTVASRCRVKYTGTWAKLQANAALAGSSCIAARFVDNSNGTVTDNLTGLTWEKKTIDATVHDMSDIYSWSATGTSADGTVFTSFLSSLNNGDCFAGHCDWRLPTREELQTILADPFTGSLCATPSCSAANFGPTPGYYHWSATSGAGFPGEVWQVHFGNGFVTISNPTDSYYVRGVRGGL